MTRIATPRFVPATEKQLSFLITLATERGWIYDNKERTLTNPEGRTASVDILSKAAASAVIDGLLKTPKVAKAQPKAESAPVVTEDGMYMIGDTIYKVQRAIHGSGRLYAKVLVIVENAVWDEDNEKIVTPAVVRFDRAPGVIFKLRPEHRMTKDQAKEFGALYGTCVRCAATLTDEESIDRGMGPVCAGKI